MVRARTLEEAGAVNIEGRIGEPDVKMLRRTAQDFAGQHVEDHLIIDAPSDDLYFRVNGKLIRRAISIGTTEHAPMSSLVESVFSTPVNDQRVHEGDWYIPGEWRR
jgi:hypothetical protein